MHLFREKKTLEKQLTRIRSMQKSIGFVPTMGALHSGHIALMKKAMEENDITVSTIFVNPTQFNDLQDFKKYPVQVDQDIQKLLEAGVSILYLPDVEEVYPEGTAELESYDFGFLETVAEGAHRPGHFQGVGQVLSRFLSVIRPDKMYMGQKDYQQLLITKKLVELLQLPTSVIGVPTRREADGLAMSSRNVRLSQEGRKIAPAIYENLCMIRNHRQQQPLAALLQKATHNLEKKGFKVEYLMLADAQTLQPAENFTAESQVLLTAVWLDGVRLIDNILLKKPEQL